jgi:hypothetical protein
MSNKVAIYLCLSNSVSLDTQKISLCGIAEYHGKSCEIFEEENLLDRPIRKKIISKIHNYSSIFFYSLDSFSSLEDFILTVKFLIDKRISFFLKEEQIEYDAEYMYKIPIVSSLYGLLMKEKNRNICVEEFYIEEFISNGESKIENDDRPHAV